MKFLGVISFLNALPICAIPNGIGLDLESITTLNNSLINFKGNVLFTTHDHAFAQSIGNRILEITPNGAIDRQMKFDEYMSDSKIRELRKEMYV